MDESHNENLQCASSIWRPSVQPTQQPLPYPSGALTSQQAHFYTRTSLAHHTGGAGSAASREHSSSLSTPEHIDANMPQVQQYNRRVLEASQSYNSSPRPFVRQANAVDELVSSTSRESEPAQQPQSLPFYLSAPRPSGTKPRAPPSNLQQPTSGGQQQQQQVSRQQDHQQTDGGSMSPKLVHQQYNSPMNLYSMNNIRETIEAHSELLAPGVKGINFMKADAPINKDSEVLKLIKEQEEEERRSRNQPQQQQQQGAPALGQAVHYASEQQHQQQQQRRVQYAAEQSTSAAGRVTTSAAENYGQTRSILKPPAQQPDYQQPSVRATLPERHSAHADSTSSPSAASSGTLACFECGQAIVGPFAKLQDRCIHPHCFNCSTCGTSLKNSGYFTISDKLYCDIHARQVANVMRLNYNFEPNKQAVVANQQQVSAEHHRDERTHQYHLAQQQSTALATTDSQQQVQTARPSVPAPVVRAHKLPAPTITLAKDHAGATTISTMFSGGAQSCQLCNSTCGCQRRSEIRWTWRPASHVEHSTAHSGARQQQQQHLGSSGTRAIESSVMQSRTLEHRNRYESHLQAHSATENRTSGSGAGGAAASRAPICCHCRVQVYGPYILAGDSTWCKPCSQTNLVCKSCRRSLLNIGFIADAQAPGQFNCEHCYETRLAPVCAKCSARIQGDCLNALGKQWHPTCFVCGHCRCPFGNASFYLEDNVPYCERDWNLLFTTACHSCGYPIGAGDKWIEALTHSYHSDCFRCTGCQVKLEGSTFYCKRGKPYCQMHAR